MKIALVHDWLPFMGGAERVLTNFSEIYPDAPIYTILCNKDKLEGKIKNSKIIVSDLQKGKKVIKNHRRLFPFMMSSIEKFDLNEYDVVLSSSSSIAKGVITNPRTLHICYCHSPMRYAWEFSYEYAGKMAGKGKLKGKLLNYFLSYVRMWDVISSNRVDYFIANSKNVSRRIWKHYRRESIVIHPPVRCSMYNISNIDENYFLVVSRLQEYKKINIAIEACNCLKVPLVIIGDGPEKKNLIKIAAGNENIKFLGRVSDEVVKEYYSRCRALLFPGEEDFGITPLEAMASGRPVIAYGKGGALETVIEGKTGMFFSEQTVEALKEKIIEFNEVKFDKKLIRKHAEKFDEEIFKKKITAFIEEKYNDFLSSINNDKDD